MPIGSRATRQPDELAVEARRWVKGHDGPRTPAVSATLAALEHFYDDLVVVAGIVRWNEQRAERRPVRLAS